MKQSIHRGVNFKTPIFSEFYNSYCNTNDRPQSNSLKPIEASILVTQFICVRFVDETWTVNSLTLRSYYRNTHVVLLRRRGIENSFLRNEVHNVKFYRKFNLLNKKEACSYIKEKYGKCCRCLNENSFYRHVIMACTKLKMIK